MLITGKVCVVIEREDDEVDDDVVVVEVELHSVVLQVYLNDDITL